MKNSVFEMSYFATGIFVHLFYDDFHLDYPAILNWDEILNQMVKTFQIHGKYDLLRLVYLSQAESINKWVEPDYGNFYEFYSFLPLFQILERSDNTVIRDWISWTIFHIFTNNSKNFVYFPTLN